MTSLARRVGQALETNITDTRPCGGGFAATAQRMRCEDGQEVFVKTVNGPSPFHAEARGLKHLNVPGGVRVPEVLHVESGLLVLEALRFGSPAPNYQTRFGEQLALTHSRTSNSFGFDLNHFIGSSPQTNLPRVPAGPGAWAEFWWTHRLEPMIQRLPPETASRFTSLESRVQEVLAGTDEPPRILHGDLWSGNAAADEHGQPVMFDPAAYYGHREADLGMTRMFGGFTPAFYQAYHAAFPLHDGWEDRLDFYMLYHVLNHAVLFSGGYLSQAEAILRRFT